MNASLSQGKVPSKWKDASVIPIPKKTPPSIDKLRPISLTPCLAKGAKGRVCKWTMNEIHSGVDARQFSNQNGVSTTHCLIDVYHHLISVESVEVVAAEVVALHQGLWSFLNL